MNEYIDKKDLIDFIKDTRQRLPHESKDFFTRDNMLLNFEQIVSQMPVVDVSDVRSGEWGASDKYFSYYQYKCSNCGCDDYTQTDRNGQCKLMRYCPNCGAKMTRTPKERGGEK